MRLRCPRCKDIQREYSLYEIAIMTRAAPARILGLADRGHLGIGAAADVVLYEPHADPEIMFAKPRYVFKDGEVVAERGEIKATPFGSIHVVKPAFDAGIERTLEHYFERYQTVSMQHFKIGDDEVRELGRAPGLVVHPCRAPCGMSALSIDGVAIEDTFAEAFGMRATRLVITAANPLWARHAATTRYGLRHLGDRLRLRGGHRDHPVAARDARRPAWRGDPASSPCRARICRSSSSAGPGNACSPARPRRPTAASRRRRRMTGWGWAARCATSATASRSPS